MLLLKIGFWDNIILIMPEVFIIEGGKELEGEIKVNGSKNSAGALISATLLTDKKCTLDNVPKISDILNLLSIVEELGKKVEWVGENKVSIEGNEINPEKLDFRKISKSRVSVLLMGPLLAKIKNFKFSRPGGDRIGLRPIATHLKVLGELGAEIKERGDFYFVNSREQKGKEIVLPEFSVTATENLIMASVFAKGTTVIRGAAQEPQVQDLIDMLNKMGAKIEKHWDHTIVIQGVKELQGVEHGIIPDPNEAGTFIAIGAAMGKSVKVSNLDPLHLALFLEKLSEIGVNFIKGDSWIEVKRPEKFYPAKVQALPYPGFPTDLLPIIVPLLTQAQGKSLIHDPLYENRFNYVHQLRKMGADIEMVDPHRAFIFGPTPLKGVTIESWDIRAGAALVIAGLMAEGKTIIENIYQIDRGYERIEERLQGMGADIKRVDKDD
jgi:UDP-N-acetylglucosamine 1-carboxyvinyltransferase